MKGRIKALGFGRRRPSEGQAPKQSGLRERGCEPIEASIRWLAAADEGEEARYPSNVFTQRPAGWSDGAEFTGGNKQSHCFR